MTPLTIQVSQCLQNILVQGGALVQQITAIALACNSNVPVIAQEQVLLSSASPDLGDRNVQLTYPRVCLYSSGFKNTQVEKFRSLSGTASVIAEIWASSDLLTDTDQWIHYYVEAVTELLRQNIGDWGDGLFFNGSFDVQVQTPKPGGLGFVQNATVVCRLNVSRT